MSYQPYSRGCFSGARIASDPLATKLKKLKVKHTFTKPIWARAAGCGGLDSKYWTIFALSTS